MRLGILFFMLMGSLSGSQAFAAIGAFNAGNLGSLTNQAALDLLKTVGLGGNYQGYHSAAPLGVALGLDVGVEATALTVPQSFKDALVAVGNTSTVPSLIPLPRLTLTKGLPVNIDLGINYVAYQGDYSWSVMGKWAFVTNPLHLAIRLSYTATKIVFIDTRTFGFDALILKKLSVISPYGGLGMQFGSGTLNFSDTSTLPVSVSVNQSFSSLRVIGGMDFNFVVLHLVPQVSYSFVGIFDVGAKVSFSF